MRAATRGRAIGAAAIQDAREALILRRETHLDQLADKLREERVRRVVGPLLSGTESAEAIPADDLEYVRDLGLVSRGSPVSIANPIYREVIPRELTHTTQAMSVLHDPAWFVAEDGTLRAAQLLTAFQEFFREHSEHWLERFQYREAGPQLLLQALLQRIVNSGGRIEREYGLGRMRTDLLIVWPLGGAARPRAEDRRRVQSGAPWPGADAPGGAAADARLHGSMRLRRGPPRDLRPHRRQALGREALQARKRPEDGEAVTVWGL